MADAAISGLLPVFLRSADVNPIVMAGLIAAAPLVGALSGTLVPREGSPIRLLRISCTVTILAASPAAVLFALAGGASTSAPMVLVTLAAVVAYGVTIAADVPTMTGSMMIVPDHLRAPFVSIVQPGLMGIQAAGALTAGAVASVLPTTSTMALALIIPVAYSLGSVAHAASRPRSTCATKPLPVRPTRQGRLRPARSRSLLLVKALVLANTGDDDPGYVGERLRERGFDLELCYRDDDSPIDLDDIDVVVLLGSDWSVYWDKPLRPSNASPMQCVEPPMLIPRFSGSATAASCCRTLSEAPSNAPTSSRSAGSTCCRTTLT